MLTTETKKQIHFKSRQASAKVHMQMKLQQYINKQNINNAIAIYINAET